jgi:N-acetylglutamate synthase-like GNAT family acetyltransferase
MIDIKPLQNELFTFANFIQNGVFIEEEIKDFWIDDFSYLLNYSQVEDKIFRDSIKRLIVPCSTFNLIEENTLIGQAYATFQENYMIINSIVINKKTRNLSYGKRLLMSMLSYALKRGAEIAIADVDYLDTAGNKLFDKVKFEDIYGYCYRIKRITK